MNDRTVTSPTSLDIGHVIEVLSAWTGVDADRLGPGRLTGADFDALALGRDHPRSSFDYAASAWASTLSRYRREKYRQNGSNRRLS